MRRTGALFAAAGIVAVAAMLGIGIAMLPFGAAIVGAVAGAALGGAVLLALAGRRALDQLNAQREMVSSVVVGLAKRVAAIEPRLQQVEQSLGRHAERNAVDRELGELGALVRLIAEEVESHDILLGADGRQEGGLGTVAPGFAAVTPPPAAPAPAAPAPVTAAAPRPVPAVRRPEESPAPPAVATVEPGARVRDAVGRGAVDLQLCAIVTLPQRRTLHYEVTAQFRDRDGAVFPDAEVAAATAGGRLAGPADALVLERAMRIARRLRERQREAGVFVRLSPQLWAGEPGAAEVVQRLGEGVDLARHLVLQFPDAALRHFGGAVRDLMADLHDKGFRFAVAGLTDLSVDARALHAMGVRFVKASPQLLLSAEAALAAEIHPDDLADFLKRYGITLIADPVEDEATVAELIDMNVTAVQGPLLGAPRPVRAEVFTERTAPPVPSIGEGLGMRVARRA